MKLRDWSNTVIPNPAEPQESERGGGATKAAFLQDARDYARAVESSMGSEFAPAPDRKGKTSKAVSVNEGGPAVAGDVSYSAFRPDGHGVYVQIGTALAGPKGGISIMARAANRENDPFGTRSQNQWLPTGLSASEMAERLRAIVIGPDVVRFQLNGPVEIDNGAIEFSLAHQSNASVV